MLSFRDRAIDEKREKERGHASVRLRPEGEAEVNKAIQRVYRHYGQNLAAFFRDVQTEFQHDQEKQIELFHATGR